MTIELPAGWSIKHNPIGSLGADTTLLDAAGNYVGSYGHVRGYYQGDPGWWECGGRRYDTSQQCINDLIARVEK